MQPKYKQKASTITKIQPTLKQSKGHPKGLKNKLTLAVRTAAYVWGDLQVTYRWLTGEATAHTNNKA